MTSRADIALISTDQKIIDRSQLIAKTYSYSCHILEKTHDFSTNPMEFRLIVVGGAEFPNGGEFSSFLKSLRRIYQEIFILFVENGQSINNSCHISLEYGADYALNDFEFYNTSKPDYIFSQVIRATFLPIKSADVIANQTLLFDIYHLLPQREKFLKFCFAGDVLDASRIEKLKSVDELYIHRNHAELYAQYLNLSTDDSEVGLNLRCRGQFLALYASYMKLVLALTDQSVQGSYERGTNLFNHCRVLASSLLSILVTHPNPWKIIHNSTVGDFGSVERGPAVAAYAGIIGFKLGLKQIEDLMIAALISEIGVLFLPRNITEHLRTDTLDQMTGEEQTEYQKYPLKSVAIALSQKLQFPETFRNIVLGIHERADKNGFPSKRYGRNIPNESYVVHFAYELDRRITVRLGKPKVDLDETLHNFIRDELLEPTHFTLEFAHSLKTAFQSNLEKN